jgi:hypothetical protein
LQPFEYVFCVQTTNNELCALIHHFGQHPLPVSVDKGDFAQIYDAFSAIAFGVAFFPTALKLCGPRSDDAPLKNPGLLGRRVLNSDA